MTYPTIFCDANAEYHQLFETCILIFLNPPQNNLIRQKHHKFNCVTEKLYVTTANGAPGRTRTLNLLIRSQTLYPIELRAPKEGQNYSNGGLSSRHPSNMVCFRILLGV